MELSMAGLITHARSEDGRKKLRYVGVSAFFFPLNQILVQVFGLWLNNYTAASLLSAAIVTLPNFFANKHLVWRFTSRENLRNQVIMFWVAAMLGVSLATLFTNFVEDVVAGQSTLVLGAAVLGAQLVGFGTVWVGKYLMLDRWLFKFEDDLPEHADEVVDEIPT